MTSIYTVRDNLKTTIAAKEALAESYGNSAISEFRAVARFLEINIDELKKILADVEVCCETATANSWIGVDRQGGI